ncbi:Protein SPO16 homolog [Lemmus lemmus]
MSYVCVSENFKNYEIATALENRSHKVRYSDTLERGSIVFSLSGVAFLLIDAKECISTEEIFLTRIEKFINIHQNSFLVLFAPLHGLEEWNLMFRIHQRFLGSNLRVLPVHNTVNAVDLMCTIAKVSHLGKDTPAQIHDGQRFEGFVFK